MAEQAAVPAAPAAPTPTMAQQIAATPQTPSAHGDAPAAAPKTETPVEAPWSKMGLVERKLDDGTVEYGREITRGGKKVWLSPTKDPEAFWNGYDRGPEHSRLAKEAAEAKQQRDAWVADIVNGLKTDRVNTIAALLEAAGENPEQGFLDILAEADRRSKMTDEQRQLEDYKKRETQREAQAKAEREKQQREADIAQQRQYMTQIDAAVREGLQQAKLPVNELLHHAVTTALEAQAIRGQQLDLNSALAYAKRVYFQSITQAVPGLGDDDLAATLGNETIGRIVKWHAAKVGGKPVAPAPASSERQTVTTPDTVEEKNDTRAAKAARGLAKVYSP